MKSRRCSRVCLFMVVATWLLASAQAVSQEDDRFQIWPEVDLFYRFDAQWRLFSFASLTRERDVPYTDWQFGANIDYSFYPLPPLLGVTGTDFERFRAFMFRVGYNRARSTGESKGKYKEDRVLAEALFRLAVTEQLLLSDRNRGEIRRVNGASCWRYRNRFRVERQFNIPVVKLTPHLSAEIYYDSRYATWNRILYSIGVEWSLEWGLILETSYEQVEDFQPNHSTLRALAVTLSLYY
jgi:hypothetical protein